MKEMPYFSHPELVARFGHSEQLKYTYYLKQGRPSFAFITFLAEEFKNGGPTIGSKRSDCFAGVLTDITHAHSKCFLNLAIMDKFQVQSL